MRSLPWSALQLGFVRMTGTTLDVFDYIPRTVLDHVSRQLGLPAPKLTTLRALYRRQMTLFAHQGWACDHAGFHRHDSTDVTHVSEALPPKLSAPGSMCYWPRALPRARFTAASSTTALPNRSVRMPSATSF